MVHIKKKKKQVCGGRVGIDCSRRLWCNVSHHLAGTAYQEARRQNLTLTMNL